MEAAERIRTLKPHPGNAEINRVRALVGDQTLPEVLDDAALLGQLRRSIVEIDRAFPTIDGEYQRENAIASRKLCEAVAPEHTVRVKKIASDLAALHGSLTDYFDFLSAVENTGASTSALRPVFPNGIGHPRDASGPFHWFFKEMRENGHISMKEIPECVR
jgi:hypothetical protein